MLSGLTLAKNDREKDLVEGAVQFGIGKQIERRGLLGLVDPGVHV
jgi:hypothetical protein